MFICFFQAVGNIEDVREVIERLYDGGNSRRFLPVYLGYLASAAELIGAMKLLVQLYLGRCTDAGMPQKMPPYVTKVGYRAMQTLRTHSV